MASHLFIKPHRRLPRENNAWVRAGDRAYVIVTEFSGMLWVAVEDGARWVARRLRAGR